MITILYNASKQKYAVYNEAGEKVLIANFGIDPNEALKSFGISSNTFVETEVFGEFPENPWKGPKNIHELSSVTITEIKQTATPVNLDEIIDSISFDTPGKDKLAYVLQKIGITKVEEELEENAIIDWPGIGKKFYVGENKGILCANTGGLATVKMAYLTGDEISVNHGSDAFLSENHSVTCDECHGSGTILDEDDIDEECDNCDGTGVIDESPEISNDDNILVEFEELPGQFFSWPVLKGQQDVLKNQYVGLTAKSESVFAV